MLQGSASSCVPELLAAGPAALGSAVRTASTDKKEAVSPQQETWGRLMTLWWGGSVHSLSPCERGIQCPWSLALHGCYSHCAPSLGTGRLLGPSLVLNPGWVPGPRWPPGHKGLWLTSFLLGPGICCSPQAHSALRENQDHDRSTHGAVPQDPGD